MATASLVPLMNLKSIASDFRADHSREALDNFSIIPQDARNQIFENVWIRDGRRSQHPQFGELAFYGNTFQVTNQVKAQAIEDYIERFERVYALCVQSSNQSGRKIRLPYGERIRQLDLSCFSCTGAFSLAFKVKNMFAHRVLHIEFDALCPFLATMDQEEYPVAAQENNDFYEKSSLGAAGWTVVAASALIGGGIGMAIEPVVSAVAAATIGMGAFSGGVIKLVKIRYASEEISRARLSRVDQKISLITERLESSSLSALERHQLQTARDNFRFKRNEFTNKPTIYVRRA